MSFTFKGSVDEAVDLPAVNRRTSRRTSPQDLSYSESASGKGSFGISRAAYERLNLDDNALLPRVVKSTGELLFAVVPDAQSRDDERAPAGAVLRRSFYSENHDEKPGEQMNKGLRFTANVLRKKLVALYGEDVTQYVFDEVDTDKDGNPVLFVRPLTDEDKADQTTPEPDDTSDADEDTPDEEPDSADDASETEDDPEDDASDESEEDDATASDDSLFDDLDDM